MMAMLGLVNASAQSVTWQEAKCEKSVLFLTNLNIFIILKRSIIISFLLSLRTFVS